VKYSDDTIMPYGGYRGFPVKNLPKKYLYNVLKDKKNARPEFIEYIIENAQRLGIKIPVDVPKLKLPKYVPPEEMVQFICDKKTFATEKDARRSLKTIRNAEGDNKKPIRVYECPECSGWHLTSMDIEIFKNEVEK